VVFSSETIHKLFRVYEEFSKRSCLERSELPESLVEFLISKDLIYLGLGGEVCIKSLVNLALELLSLGYDVESISKLLNWKYFEELVSNHLTLSGYHVIRNLRFGLRRYEVDVVGIEESSEVGLVIDCKHWGPNYSKRGRLTRIASDHRVKVEELSARCGYVLKDYKVLTKAKYLIPVIVTLTDSLSGYVNGSFIVPILRFKDFVSNVMYYVDLLSGRSGMVLNSCYVQIKH